MFGSIDWNPFSRYNRSLVNIMLLCVYAFIVSTILGWIPGGDTVLDAFKLSPSHKYLLYKPYSFVSYMFIHSDLESFFSNSINLALNLVFLYFVGVILEDLTGNRHIWKLFLGGGLTGGVAYVLIYQILPTSIQSTLKDLVGASAGVSSVIIGAATFSPNYSVYLFGMLRIEIRWIAFFKIFIDLLGLAIGSNLGGYIAHLGGALFGFLYILHIKGRIHIPFVDNIAELFTRSKAKPLRPARSASVNINREEKRQPEQDEIDRILDKINKSGYESLSKSEKEALFRAGDKD
jgi:membrane associated rhomboid family serine protease